MYEMLEVILKVVLLLGLFYIAWFDYRTKLIDVKWLLIVGAIGVIGIWLQKDMTLLREAMFGMLLGGCLLLLAWISGESIGFGDGWLFVVTGIFLGFIENFILLFGSLIMAGVFAIVCLVLKKKRRNDRVALAPFVLASYVMFVL